MFTYCAVGDGVEGAPFFQWDGLESEIKFGRVVTSSEGESVEDRRQPGIEVIGQSTPVDSDEFRRLETGRRWWNRRGRGWAVGWRGGYWSKGGDVSVQDVHGNLPGGAEVRAAIKDKVQVGFQGLSV